jgi:short-subunit dehydrogenase
MDIVTRYGPWAVIAGASAGMGAAWADEVAAQGINLVTIARRGELLEADADRLRRTHAIEVRPVATDLAGEDIADVVRRAVDDIDVGLFVYNAAVAPAGSFFTVPIEEHLMNVRVNCVAPTVLTHVLGPPMIARGRGGIALVGSIGALQGGEVFASYFAAKAYEWILAEGIWAELRGTGVDVVAYMLGATSGDNYEHPRETRSIDVEQLEPAVREAMEGVLNPLTSREVAAGLFERLADGPTVYSSAYNERVARSIFGMSRREAVERMSAVTTLSWS